MTAVNRSTAGFMPMLEMEMVPPWYSSGLSLPSRARFASSLTDDEMLTRPLASTDLTIGVMRPLGVDTATETSTVLNCRMTPSLQDELTWGTFLQATLIALMRKSLTLSLYPPSDELLRAWRSLRSFVTERLAETK